MKVAFFSFGILEQGGGFENFLVQTAPGLNKAHPDLDITIITATDRLTKKLQSLLTVYYFQKQSKESIYRETTENINNKLGKVQYIKVDSLKAIKKELQNYDIIHSKNEILELYLLSIFGFKNLPPVIIGIHTPVVYPYAPSIQSKLHNFLYLKFYRSTTKKLASVYVQNQDDLSLIKDKIRYDKVRVINQALDIKAKKPVIHSTEKLRILFVGRLSEQKGIDILLECINLLSHNSIFNSLEFRIAGTGDPRLIYDIEQTSKKFNNVEFLGHVAHIDMGKLYSWTDITVVPSRYETLCKVAIETGMHGKVAIVSDIPGPREVVVDQRTGYLIPPNSSDFVAKIIELHRLRQTNKDKFYKIGEEAQKYLEVTFDPEKAYQDLADLIRESYAEA